MCSLTSHQARPTGYEPSRLCAPSRAARPSARSRSLALTTASSVNSSSSRSQTEAPARAASQQEPASGASSETTHGSSAARRCDVTLAFRGRPATLSADRYALSRASPVLHETLGRLHLLEEEEPGVLELPVLPGEEEVSDWDVVVEMLQQPGGSGHALALVNWDNLEPLARLADKYDMAVVHRYCAHFLSLHTAAMSLEAPLTSPKNPLTAASLLDRFCNSSNCGGGGGGGEQFATELQPYVNAVHRALDGALAPLSDWAPASMLRVAARLRALMGDERYRETVAESVKTKVLSTLLAGMEAQARCPACVRHVSLQTAGGDGFCRCAYCGRYMT